MHIAMRTYSLYSDIACTRRSTRSPLCSTFQSGNVVQDAVAAEDDADTQEELHTLYKPQRLDDPDAGPHPDAVVETQAVPLLLFAAAHSGRP